jgi:aminoglycoside phosphotransferase (APT) family kinase protein
LARFGPGDWRLEGWHAEPERYRVDLRACVRLTVRASEIRTGSAAERRFFAKIYATAEEVERAWRIQREVAAALGAEHEPLAVAPLVAYLPEARILVQAEATGVSLLQLLRTPTSEIAGTSEAVRRTARAIAALHRLGVAAPPHRIALGRLDPQRLRRSTDLIRAARADLAPELAEIEAGVLAGLAALGEAPAVPVHGDLKPGHVLFDHDRVVVLDLDKFAAGDAMQDVTSMLIHLGQERRGSKDTRALTRAFVTEYFADAPTGWEQRLAPHYAWALLGEAASVAGNVAQTAAQAAEDRPRHEQRLSFLLEEAQAVLAGGAWSLDPASTPVPGMGEADESVGRLEAQGTNTLAKADQRQMTRRARREERQVKRNTRTEERRAKRNTRTEGP